MHLSWVEVRQRYRRSVIGPWWISLSMLIFIVAMGEVYSRLFKQDMAEYIPFFTAGYLIWIFISQSMIEATEIFKTNASFVKQIQLPFNLYIFKHLARHLILLAHNIVVYLLVMIYFRVNPGWEVLWIIPGFALLVVNMYWICLLIALLSARYRDTVPLISSCVQIAFFITPISWMPKLIGPHSLILKLNPFVYFLGATRNPLTGSPITMNTWIYNLTAACVGLLFTWCVFAWIRSRIIFWID